VTRHQQHLVGLALCAAVFVLGSARLNSVLGPLWVLAFGTVFTLAALSVFVLLMFFAYTDDNPRTRWVIAAYSMFAGYWAFLMSGFVDIDL
jgi:hypothetical protein